MFLAMVLTTASIASAQERAIPADNLLYPVLITVKNGSDAPVGFGSGFYLNTDQGVYLVTAKHVIAATLPDPNTQQVMVPDARIELLSYSKDQPSQRIILALKVFDVLRSGALQVHPSQDVAVVKIATVVALATDKKEIHLIPGITANEWAESGILGAGKSIVKRFDDVLVGNDAILYGYPVSLALKQNVPLFDPYHPLIRRGLIAGLDAPQHSIIIDGSVFPGNSGGPVIEVDHNAFQTHFYLIGVLTNFIPRIESTDDFYFQQNSGYSVARPMDFVLDLIK